MLAIMSLTHEIDYYCKMLGDIEINNHRNS